MHYRIFVLAGIFALTISASTSTARANWGCLAKSSTHTWRVWGYPDKPAAIKQVIANCKTAKEGRCVVTECKDSINKEDDAMAEWPLSKGVRVDHCFGSGCTLGRQ